jgi:hypothetical protein
VTNRYDLFVHDDFDDLGDSDEDVMVSIVADLPAQLRARCCTNEPWAGPDPAVDHGHTDCWLMGLAAQEIERLRG